MKYVLLNLEKMSIDLYFESYLIIYVVIINLKLINIFNYKFYYKF